MNIRNVNIIMPIDSPSSPYFIFNILFIRKVSCDKYGFHNFTDSFSMDSNNKMLASKKEKKIRVIVY